jgi:hypothetical protein
MKGARHSLRVGSAFALDGLAGFLLWGVLSPPHSPPDNIQGAINFSLGIAVLGTVAALIDSEDSALIHLLAICFSALLTALLFAYLLE